MSKRAMISQPMGGIKPSEIIRIRTRAFTWLQENGYSIENTLFTGEEYSNSELYKQGVNNNGIYMLGKSLEAMSKVDTVYFCKGWDKARGCQIEHSVAKSYGLHVLYED